MKEFIEARWKAIIGGVVAVLCAASLAGTYNLIKNLLAGQLTGNAAQQIPSQLQGTIQQLTGSYDGYVWSQWFSKNGPEILAILAAVLGASLIANEVNKGTIFFLLSKPVSRGRVLLTKYLVSTFILLGVMVLSGIALLVAAAIVGHPQNVGGVLISTVLLWLGILFVLGLALLFSVLFHDVLRPLIFSLLLTLLLSIPGFIPNATLNDWSLTFYWSDFAAYQGTMFPLKALLICLIAALVPVVLAIVLFRKQAY
ncbi:MAG TPA: ABC transporter permease [Ktedonobacteraceae bacterium]|nr:ABC transporter permease [Ktedonobacteraceae bacterium]